MTREDVLRLVVLLGRYVDREEAEMRGIDLVGIGKRASCAHDEMKGRKDFKLHATESCKFGDGSASGKQENFAEEWSC